MKDIDGCLEEGTRSFARVIIKSCFLLKEKKKKKENPENNKIKSSNEKRKRIELEKSITK